MPNALRGRQQLARYAACRVAARAQQPAGELGAVTF
jgi:hypothetical protein